MKEINLEIKDKRVIKYVNLIHSSGGRCYIVGGYVRDYLLGKTSSDIDIEVYNLTFEQLKNIFKENAKIYSNFGVFSLLGSNVEFAIARKENKIGIKHKDFLINLDPYMNIKEAALRRDFTINSLMYDLKSSEIVDCYSGLTDLKSKRIKHISTKFNEDALRVLRALRFSFTLGFDIDENTVKECFLMFDDLTYISTDRKNNELKKMFLTEHENFKIGLEYFNLIMLNYFGIGKINNKAFKTEEIQELINHSKKRMYLINLNKEKYFNNNYFILMFSTFLLMVKQLYSLLDKNLTRKLTTCEFLEGIFKEFIKVKKEQKLISNLISDFNSIINLGNINEENLIILFEKYKDDITLLIEYSIVNILPNIKDYNSEKILTEYEKVSKRYYIIEQLYHKYIVYKKKYDGKYFMAMGYEGKDIACNQKKKIKFHLKNDIIKCIADKSE